MVAALRRGLNEAGAIEGQSFVLEFLWAEGKYDRLPAFANDFVRRPVAVIVATGGSDPALAAKTATRTTPIVFTGVSILSSLALLPVLLDRGETRPAPSIARRT